jgi:hypothetical protein
MAKSFIGIDGYYEIYNRTSIIHRKINKSGQATEKYKVYNNVKNIPSRQDRWRIEEIIVGKNSTKI